MNQQRSENLFISYADEDKELLKELEKQLQSWQLVRSISTWHNQKIQPGSDRKQEIDKQLSNASVILLLVSPDFLASDYDGTEMQRAMERHTRGEAKVIPILLRPVDWEHTPFGELQFLPRNGRPVTMWKNRDSAFLEITRELAQVIRVSPSLVPSGSPPSPPSQDPHNKSRSHRSRLRKVWLPVFLVIFFIIVISGILLLKNMNEQQSCLSIQESAQTSSHEIFKIVSIGNDEVLENSSGLLTLAPDDTKNPNQQWYFFNVGPNDSFHIGNKSLNMVLDDSEASIHQNSPIAVYDYSPRDPANQFWTCIPGDNGYIKFVNYASRWTLDASSGKMTQQDSNSNPSQFWRVEQVIP